ncbi:hypothetical protein MPLSOD_40472 [Mesorhizobium sp. SOD10]|nr:hypothetical protein MPLSOD_40472 [Mesorhizobium sp. SOD10]
MHNLSAENLAKLSKIKTGSRDNCIRFRLLYLRKNIDKNSGNFRCTKCLFSGTIARVASWFGPGT